VQLVALSYCTHPLIILEPTSRKLNLVPPLSEQSIYSRYPLGSTFKASEPCRMGLPGPTASVANRTDYSVGPWDYSTWVTRHLMAWGARTTMEEYSDRKLCMSCTM
jgi:hypothetical protein